MMSVVINNFKRKIAVSLLKKTSAEKFVKIQEDKIIPALRRAARKIPAYGHLLREKGIDLDKVKDLSSFSRLIPVINKDIFHQYEIAQLCQGGNLKGIKTVSLSSGFSGNFSYSLMSHKESALLGPLCDVLMDYEFNISKKKTFWISCLGMGVKVYTDSLALAETSVRSDMVLALVKKLERNFDQIIIIGSTYFIKKVIEDGIEQGLDWKTIQVHFIIGEDWFPENYRSYLLYLVGEKNRILTTLGISELGLSLFLESKDTIRIRRLAEKDRNFRFALFGESAENSPEFFHHLSFNTYLEVINDNFVFTTLNPDAVIPLIRYSSGDKGKIHPYRQFAETLIKFGYKDYIPEIQLPLVSVMGRKEKIVKIGNIYFTPEQVKTGIYSDFELAAVTTGYFRMSNIEGRLRIELQLKEKINSSQELKNRFYQVISAYIKADFELLLYAYRDFPYGMGLIYENKFRYI